MGWFPAVACLALGYVAGTKYIIADLVAVRIEADVKKVQHHVANGGCLEEFNVAVRECHPDLIELRKDSTKQANNVEACVKATTAMRECFAGNPEWFKHVYLRRIDEGLDQDRKPEPEEMLPGTFRWWAGMRRS